MAANSAGSYRNKYNLGIADFVNVVSFPDDFPEHCSAAFIKYADEGAFPGYSLIGFLDNISESFTNRIENEHIGWPAHDVRSFVDNKADSFLEINAKDRITDREQFREDCFLYVIYRTKLKLQLKTGNLKGSIGLSESEVRDYPDYYYLGFREFLDKYPYSKKDLINHWSYIEPVMAKVLPDEEARIYFIDHLFKVTYSIDKLLSGDMVLTALQTRDSVKDSVDNYLSELKLSEKSFNKMFYDSCFLVIVYKIYALKQKENGVDEDDTYFVQVVGERFNRNSLIFDFDPSAWYIGGYDQFFSEFIKGISVSVDDYVSCLENISVGINIALPGNEKLKDFIEHLSSLASIIVKTNPENRYDVTALKLRAAVKDLIDMHLKNREADISVLQDSFYDDCFRIIIYRIQMAMKAGEAGIIQNNDVAVTKENVVTGAGEYENSETEKRPFLVYDSTRIRDFVPKIHVDDNIAADLAKLVQSYSVQYEFDMDKLIDYIDTITDEFMDAIIMKKSNPQVKQIRMSVDNRISLFLKDYAHNRDKAQVRKLCDNCFIYNVTQIKLYQGDRITEYEDYFGGKQNWTFRQLISSIQFVTGKDADDARLLLDKKLREKYTAEITASFVRNLNKRMQDIFDGNDSVNVKVSTIYGILSEFIDKYTEVQNKQDIGYRIHLEDLSFLYILYRARIQWQSKLNLRLTANALKKEIIEAGAQSMTLSFIDYLEKVNISEADIEKKSESVISVSYGILNTMALTEKFITFLVDTAFRVCNTPAMMESNVKDLRKEIRKMIKDFFVSNRKNANTLSREFYDDCFTIVVSRILEERRVDQNSLETIDDEIIGFSLKSDNLSKIDKVDHYREDYSLLFWDFVQETNFPKEVVEKKLKRVLDLIVRAIPESDKMSFTCYLIDVAWFTYNNTPSVFERPAIESNRMLKDMIKNYITEKNGNKNILTQSFYDDCVFIIFNEIQKRLNKDRMSNAEGVERRLPAKSIKLLLPDFSLGLPDFITEASIKEADYLDKKNHVSTVATGMLESIDLMKNFMSFLTGIAERFCKNYTKAGTDMTASTVKNNAVLMINNFFLEQNGDISRLTTRFYDDCFLVIAYKMQTLANEGKVFWLNPNDYGKDYIEDNVLEGFEVGSGDTGQRIYRESYNIRLKDFLYSITFDDDYEQNTIRLLTSYSQVGGFSVSKLIHYMSAVHELLVEDIRKNDKDWRVMDIKRYIDHKMDLFFVYNPDAKPGNKPELYDCCFAYAVYKLKFGKSANIDNNVGEDSYNEINNIGDLIYLDYIDKMPSVSGPDISYAFDRLCLKESLLNKDFNSAHFKVFADSLVPKIMEASKSPGCKVFDILGYISQSMVNYRKLGENRCAGFTAFTFHYVSLLVKQAGQKKRDSAVRDKAPSAASSTNNRSHIQVAHSNQPGKESLVTAKKKKGSATRFFALILLSMLYLFFCVYRAEYVSPEDANGKAYDYRHLNNTEKYDAVKSGYITHDNYKADSEKKYFKDEASGHIYLLTQEEATELTDNNIPELREASKEEVGTYSGSLKGYTGEDISQDDIIDNSKTYDVEE